MLRLAGLESEDELGADGLADRLEEKVEDRPGVPFGLLTPVDLNQYDLRKLVHDVERDIDNLRDLHEGRPNPWPPRKPSSPRSRGCWPGS